MCPDKTPLETHLLRYFRGVGREYRTRSAHLSCFIKHRYTIGVYREEILRSFIRARIGSSYRIETGFFSSKKRDSHQHDIMIVEQTHVPYHFHELSFSVVDPARVRCVIEVKSRLLLDDLVGIWRKAADASKRNPSVFTVGVVFAGIGKRAGGGGVKGWVESIIESSKKDRGLRCAPDLVILNDQLFLWRIAADRITLFRCDGVNGMAVLYGALHERVLRSDAVLHHGAPDFVPKASLQWSLPLSPR